MKAIRHFIMLLPKATVRYAPIQGLGVRGGGMSVEINARVGDTAVALLKAGADFSLKTIEDKLAIDLAPDKEASVSFSL
jgi:hypothetical protein